MVLMVATAVAAYYVFYNNQKKEYLAARSNRLLDVMAEGIVRAVVTSAGGHAIAVTTPRAQTKQECTLGSDTRQVSVQLSELSLAGVLTLRAFEYPDRDESTLDLRDVVDWRLLNDRFDDVWIVRNDRKTLLAQMNPAAAPVSRTLNIEQHDRDPASSQNPAESATGSLASVLRSFLPSQAARIQLRGEGYLVFSTPLVIPTRPESRGGIDLTLDSGILGDVGLYGVVRESRFTRDALALSYRGLMAVSALVLLGFLVLPYVKIRFMARRERLRWIDFWLLGTSGLVAAQIGIFGIIVMAWHGVMTPRFDAALGRFAEEIAAHAKEEVAAATNELDANTEDLVADTSIHGRVYGIRPAVGTQYSGFEALFYADEGGWQRSKWMPWGEATNCVSIATEPYFREALASASETPRWPVFAATDAPNSGKQLAVLAQPVLRDSKPGVTVLATKMFSLSDIVAPYPLEYVLLDEKGQVVFRSRPGSNPRENFLSEMDFSADLFARVSGARVWFDSQYLGRPHRMHLAPLTLKGAPRLSLLTFYDRAVLDTIMFEATIASFVWIFVSGMAVVLAMVLARVTFGPWSNEWLWPSERRSELYVVATALLAAAVLVIVLHAVRCGVGSLTIFGPAGVMAVASFPPLHRAARKTTEWVSSKRWARGWYPYTYLAFMTALLIATGAIPAWLIASDAFRAYVEAFGRVTEGRWAAALEDRYQAVRAVYVPESAKPSADAQHIPVPDGRERDIEQCRLAQTWDLYTPVLAGRVEPIPVWQRQPPACASPMTTRRMDRRRGHARLTELPRCGLNFDVVDLPKTRSPVVAMAAACLPETDSNGLEMRVQLVAPEPWTGQPAPALYSWVGVRGGMVWPVPSVDIPGLLDLGGRGIALYVLLPGLAVVIIAWLVTRSVASDILGLELEGDGIVDERESFANLRETGLDEARWLLLRPPPGVRAGVDPNPKVDVFDLEDAFYGGTDEPPIYALARARVIHGVHAKLTYKGWRKAILARLTTCLDGSLVVTSDIDPIYWLATHVPADPAAAKEHRTELAQWSAALATFRKWRFPVVASDPPVADSAACVIDDECQWTDELGEIAKRLDPKVCALMSASRIVEHIGDHAEPYYRSIWNLCSEDEKVVLIQLAEEGLVNPRHFSVLRRLRRRRLVRTHGQIRIMNESFARFVREAEDPSTIARWESPAPGTGSARIRLPLFAVATVCGALLLFTQQHLFDSLTGVATAAVGALGAVSGLVSSFRKHVSQA